AATAPAHCDKRSPCPRDAPGAIGSALIQIRWRPTPYTIAFLCPHAGEPIEHLLRQRRTIAYVVGKLFPDRLLPIPLAHVFPRLTRRAAVLQKHASPFPGCGAGAPSAG